MAAGLLMAGTQPASAATSRQLFIGQGNVNAFSDATSSLGASASGGSVYYGVKAGTWQGASGSASHKAFADQLAAQGKDIEVGISWKDDPPGWNGNNDVKAAASQQATSDIAAGRYDGQFTTLTDYISAHRGSTFHLRLDYEVSSAFHCAGGTDCSSYKNAFRHLVGLIDSRTGGTNVSYVYHPVRGEFDKLYPGDDVVDEVGVSIFNAELCQPFWFNGTTYWNGTEDTSARTCSGYYDDIVNGNRNAIPHGYPVDLNVLRMMWWAQQHNKPMIVAESTPQRMAEAEDSNGVQASSDYVAWVQRLQTLLSYKGPLPNGVVDGQQTSFLGTNYDLSSVIRTVVFINLDWRYGFDGKVSDGQPFGTSTTDGWFVNSLLSANPAGRNAFCSVLSSQGFTTTCS